VAEAASHEEQTRERRGHFFEDGFMRKDCGEVCTCRSPAKYEAFAKVCLRILDSFFRRFLSHPELCLRQGIEIKLTHRKTSWQSSSPQGNGFSGARRYSTFTTLA
jgi:hypothetical protein